MDIPRAPRPKRHRYFLIGGGLAVLLLMTYGLSSLEPRAPSVDMATQYTDTVARGPMVREVRAPGTLVPERRYQVSAVTPGRVETLPLRPGAEVEPNTVIATLTNPDVDLQLLEAQRQLGTAQATLITLRSSLAQQRLQQEGAIRQMEADYNDADRELRMYEALAAKNLAAPNEVARARDRAQSLAKRLDYEREQLDVLERSVDAQVAQAQQQVRQMERIVAFQQERQASMTVRAGEEGVLQELPLDYGVYVQSGQLLARIAKPGALKAELRVPESQAKDIAVGQKATIDTRNGLVAGRVSRIDPIAVTGTVTVEVALEGKLPAGARSDMSVDGTIEIERLPDVMYVARPSYGQPESTTSLFRVDPDGKHATRVQVQLGRASVSTIEVRGGLQVGDRVIISDMSQVDGDRVRLK
ncbi:MAG TPA: HlyD family efflux transporter periplasmic adaptor subunit [Gemmatimonadaceae bacterium]|nr:HlyD family efflux transporter periplasmic adaptor subunit [Gemmatimonadaceae bacterium]